jgi:hypothetical protein
VTPLGISGFAMVAALAWTANAAEQNCDQYAALNRLPDSFEEIASGDLGKAEFFVLTDRRCTCDNEPAVSRRLGKPAPQKINWSCRESTPDERRSD